MRQLAFFRPRAFGLTLSMTGGRVVLRFTQASPRKLRPTRAKERQSHSRLPLLQRRAETKTIYGRDHLLDGDLGGVKGHHRLLRLETYICPIHAIQPFQGLLDRDGSGPSRHSIDGEDDGRGRRHTDIHSDQYAEQ